MFKMLMPFLACGIILVSSNVAAGGLNGPERGKQTLGQEKEFKTFFVFKKESQAMIRVSGDGNSDLDCYLYDDNMRELDRDTSSDDQCRLWVIPKQTGKFHLRVINLGSINHFEFWTN